MNLLASVLFQNALAHYSITEEEEGVFLAQLQHYSGLREETPPTRILLIRGIRRWIGSLDNPEVLDALGHAIDTSATSPTPSPPLVLFASQHQNEQQPAPDT